MAVVERNVHVYTENKEWLLLEAGTLESASHFKSKKAMPLIQKFISTIRAITLKYIDIKSKLDTLQEKYNRIVSEMSALKGRFLELRSDNDRLRETERDLNHIKRVYGKETIDMIIKNERKRDSAEQKIGRLRPHDHER